MSEPGYGPGGYLPERAARRARKIVLRERMGLGWPLAALGTAVGLIASAVAFVVLRSGGPGPPFEEVAALAGIDPRGGAVVDTSAGAAFVLRAGGRVRAFALPVGAVTATWCAASSRIEDPDGRVWTAEGVLVGGEGASLAPLPARVHEATVYVDPTTPAHPPAPRQREESPTCK